MIEFETEVTEVIQRTPTVKSFRFKIKEEANFKPGQFFFVTIKIEGGLEKSKHFSFSNSPTEKGYVEFTKRLTDSDYSKALNILKPGDWAKLRMPLGLFTFQGEYERIAFLSGGIGITPIRSICKFATDKNLATDIVLLYSNRSEDEIAFKDDFNKMQVENRNIRVVHTLTLTDMDRYMWKGRAGYIDENMIRQEIADFKERVFYLCGPPAMVAAMSGLLNSMGLGKDKIRIENFTGY